MTCRFNVETDSRAEYLLPYRTHCLCRTKGILVLHVAHSNDMCGFTPITRDLERGRVEARLVSALSQVLGEMKWLVTTT